MPGSAAPNYHPRSSYWSRPHTEATQSHTTPLAGEAGRLPCNRRTLRCVAVDYAVKGEGSARRKRRPLTASTATEPTQCEAKSGPNSPIVGTIEPGSQPHRESRTQKRSRHHRGNPPPEAVPILPSPTNSRVGKVIHAPGQNRTHPIICHHPIPNPNPDI